MRLTHLFAAILPVLLLPRLLAAQAPDSLHPVDRIPVADTVKVPVLDFKNTDIRDIYRALGMQYRVNIFVEPGIQGPVSLYLTNTSLRNAIDFIARQNNLAYAVENGIVRIFRPPPPAAPPPPPGPPQVFHLSNRLMEVDVTDMPARQLARMFADSTALNVVVDPGVEKTITTRLTGLAPEKAVRTIFDGAGLQTTLSDGIYYVSQKQWGGEQSAGQGASAQQRVSITVNKDRSVTMQVDNASLDQSIRTIAVQSGINVFIYDQITGMISAKFDSIPLDDALRFLLQNTKFTFWKDKGIYFIGSREMSEQKTSLVLPLRHIMADEAQLAKVLPPHITKSSEIKYDKEHNSLIVIGSFDVIAQAQEFIEKLDRPIPQVLIEALVVDFNINKIREYGVSLFTQGAGDSTGGWNSEKFLPGLELKPGRQNTARVLHQVLGVLGINRVVQLPSNFRSIIQALETADVVKVHSTPQIATINGNSASITIGETRYYKLTKETRAAVNTSENVLGTDQRFEKVELNTRLEVTPWVMDSGYVMVKIHPEFQIPRSGGSDDRPPTTDNRVLESMVRLRDGQSIVLGGQRQTSNVVNSKGIPFLSSIPILGFLFSSRTTSAAETQMMIFLTPHVYYGNEGEVKPDEYFGKEINQILDKGDPDRIRKRSQERREKREQARQEKSGELHHEATKNTKVHEGETEGGGNATSDTPRARRWHWPWEKKKDAGSGTQEEAKTAVSGQPLDSARGPQSAVKKREETDATHAAPDSVKADTTTERGGVR